MKMKKGILFCSIMALTIIGTSKIASAATSNYAFQLPATGSQTTASTLKGNSSVNFNNNVLSLGRPGNTINFWGNLTSGGSQVTSTGAFTSTGNQTASYGSQASATYYANSHLYMTIKTGTTVFFAIDITGAITP